MKILVAEDNAINQKLILHLLNKFGYSADIVTNGKEALEALRTIPYDLVFMDIQMPIMDGFAATHIIRDPQSHVFRHDVPIIAMTANAMKGDKKRCMEEGMNGYVSKPINPKELQELIETFLHEAA